MWQLNRSPGQSLSWTCPSTPSGCCGCQGRPWWLPVLTPSASSVPGSPFWAEWAPCNDDWLWFLIILRICRFIVNDSVFRTYVRSSGFPRTALVHSSTDLASWFFWLSSIIKFDRQFLLVLLPQPRSLLPVPWQLACFHQLVWPAP